MLRRFVPHPLLTLTLTVVWVMLINDVSAGTVAFGLILGIVIPQITAPYWPNRPPLRSLPRIAGYVLVVLWDIVIANIQVAAIILFRPQAGIRTRWVAVPLELTSPEAISVLAGTITMTPGTVSADISADGRTLLVHCLDTADPEATAQGIKSRYEARLKEIFR